MRKAFFAVLTSVGLLLGLGVTVAPAASAATSTDVWFVRVNIAGQVNAPVALSTMTAQATNVRAFWRSVPGSPGMTGSTPQVTYTHPSARTCTGNWPDSNGAIEAGARAYAGVPAASKLVLYLASSQTCNANGVSNGRVAFVFDGAESTAVHETGHDLGFEHDRSTPTPGFPPDGSEEYGNTYSIMGGKTIKPYGIPAGWQLVRAGWMTYTFIPRVNSPTKIVTFKTASTSARLLRFDIANAATPGGWDVYYVEYRYGETSDSGEVGGAMLYQNGRAVAVRAGAAYESLFKIATSYTFAKCYVLNVSSPTSTGAIISYAKTC